MVGFGVSIAAQSAAMPAKADSVIIGNAMLRLIEGAESIADAANQLKDFAKRIRLRLDSFQRNPTEIRFSGITYYGLKNYFCSRRMALVATTRRSPIL